MSRICILKESSIRLGCSFTHEKRPYEHPHQWFARTLQTRNILHDENSLMFNLGLPDLKNKQLFIFEWTELKNKQSFIFEWADLKTNNCSTFERADFESQNNAENISPVSLSLCLLPLSCSSHASALRSQAKRVESGARGSVTRAMITPYCQRHTAR